MAASKRFVCNHGHFYQPPRENPWLETVEMLLIFRLGRPDVLPATDYGVRKGFALTFLKAPKTRPLEAKDLPKPEVLLKRGKRWAPFRSVASWYLWRACDLARNTAPTGRSSLQ